MSEQNPQSSVRAPRILSRGGPRVRSNNVPLSRGRQGMEPIPSSRPRRNFPIPRPRNQYNQNLNINRPPRIFRRRVIRRRNFQNRFFPNQNNRRTLNYRRLFISGIGNSLNNNQLHSIFSKYGKLTRCRINYDIMGRSRGNANVDFVFPQDARRAINSLNGAQIGRKIMIVRFDRGRVFRNRLINRRRNFRRLTFRRINFRRRNLFDFRRRRNFRRGFNRRIAFGMF